MSGFKSINFANDTITKTPSGSLLSAVETSLFDGKLLNIADLTSQEIWEATGTGTQGFNENKVDMSVGVGQYLIRQSTRWMPYFSGYPQLIEITFDGFGIQADVIKRVGYFSSSATAPYSTVLDGFWLEMDGTTFRLKAARGGTSTVDVPFTSWDGYNLLSGWNFNNFTAIYFDFLWLGGAALRLWIAHPTLGWVLAHSAQYIGNNTNTMTLSPNQPLRYELRSDGGAGSMREICSRVSVAGQLGGVGFTKYIYNSTGIACNAVGTVYALKGFKKNTTRRNIAVQIASFGSANAATTDTGILMILKNPTLSAALTYAADGNIDSATGTGQTVTNVGQVISLDMVSISGKDETASNFRTWLTQKINNTFDEYVLAYQPLSTNQTVNGYVSFTEYCN